MVGKRARSPDLDTWATNVGKRLTLRAKVDRRAYEGLLVHFHPGYSDGQAKVDVIHTDGLLRKWNAADIEMIDILSDKPFSKKDIEERVASRAGRGGTAKGQELRQEGQLPGKHIHVWVEEEMKWDPGEVIEPVDGDVSADTRWFSVKMNDTNVKMNLADSVWMLDGESPTDILKNEADVVVLEDRSIPVVVTEQPSSKKMNVYVQTKYCSADDGPQVYVSENAIHVHDKSTSGDVSRDVVVMLKEHHQCDTREVVEAVLDKEAWLRVTFRRRT